MASHIVGIKPALASESVDISSGDHEFDSAIFGAACDAIYTGSGGDIVVRMHGDGEDRTFKSVPAGQVLAIAASHVRQTGTTATDLVGLKIRNEAF